MENGIYIAKIIMYFIVYSFFGWIMESVLKTILQKKPVNSGFLYGPFCPIYGFGAIIMFAFLQSFKENLVLLFIIAFFVLSLWEYIVGLLLEKIFNTKYWDYSENKFNIQGRVCLMNSLFWGILGVVFIRYIHPFIIEKIDIISTNDLLFLTVTLSAIIIVDLITSIIKIKNITLNLEKLKEITNTIKEKLTELEEKQLSKENLQLNKEILLQAIEDLKYRQTKIKRKLIKQTNRLKKAFPSMKSEAIEKINEFLKEKKENIKNRKN